MGKINRVLMLAHPEMDHLSYMMYNGLYKILGKDNIAIYPYVRHYQGGIDDWYTLDDGKRGYTSPTGYIGKHETPERSFDDLANNIRSFDIIYLSSGRTYAVRALEQFATRCGGNLPPIVMSEGEDYQHLNTIRVLKHRFGIRVCFKRELTQNDLNNAGDLQPLYPLPFSAIMDNTAQDNPNKDLDVFALFGNTWPIREEIVKVINSSYLREKYKVHVGIDHFERGSAPYNAPAKTYKDYHDMMSRSKINIVARGWGTDTLRRFEAACYSGLVLSDNLPIITPDPFTDNANIRYYNDNLSDLVGLIEHYLNNQTDRERIGKAGREHCMNHHTTEARARYFLGKVEGHI